MFSFEAHPISSERRFSDDHQMDDADSSAPAVQHSRFLAKPATFMFGGSKAPSVLQAQPRPFTFGLKTLVRATANIPGIAPLARASEIPTRQVFVDLPPRAPLDRGDVHYTRKSAGSSSRTVSAPVLETSGEVLATPGQRSASYSLPENGGKRKTMVPGTDLRFAEYMPGGIHNATVNKRQRKD